ncbi:hypothetical protein [Christiangramia sabulilitoris]|uniref:Uncharacterized protein n=1 Tax=Christiangramia sabulilitoris TaxID=2583991 RepID=A0A550I3G1_9FLAO|nr:hypothetical protein [Christiangramia sabulilitoris]TRO65505.1 hypothetical protein FGM01_08890 [Christiangramia sabulilitoris]
MEESHKKNQKAVTGELSDEEYKTLRNSIEKNLKTRIPEKMSILINYENSSPECYFYKGDAFVSKIIDNKIRISKRVSEKYKAIDFFLYPENTNYDRLFQNKEKYIQENGYFKDSIFKDNFKCSAFLILKPNGKFMRYYGSDYYTEVGKFLAEK